MRECPCCASLRSLSLKLLQEELSFEPYGIALPRGDAAFRPAVNTGLAQIYRSDEINEIFSRWFACLRSSRPYIHSGQSPNSDLASSPPVPTAIRLPPRRPAQSYDYSQIGPSGARAR
ncbi:MAG: transporter substrate-binding domain-containing protein [Burkholderiales bacterium]|nr:transporter substrate-binding domain-containing protein [Burkholderiales bacterium]